MTIDYKFAQDVHHFGKIFRSMISKRNVSFAVRNLQTLQGKRNPLILEYALFYAKKSILDRTILKLVS